MKKQQFKQLIKECVKSVISEMDISNPNPESDDMPYEPRDRVPNIGGDLQIPHFPNSILKKVNLDGKQKFFVYSDTSPTALILGYSESEDGAVENARKTSTYIKQGGVDNNFGELTESKK